MNYSTILFYFLILSIPICFPKLTSNFIYLLVLHVNFYYIKLVNYLCSFITYNIKDLEVTNAIDLNLSITIYNYKNQKFIELTKIGENKTPYIDDRKYNLVRDRIECPNSRDSYLMASIEIRELKDGVIKKEIDILEDIQSLAGPYFEGINNIDLISKYLEYKYNINKSQFITWSYMMSDGEEYKYTI